MSHLLPQRWVHSQYPIEGQPDVHFINDNISAADMFGSDGLYTLTIEATDANSNLGRETVSVYYDSYAAYMYFCNDFGRFFLLMMELIWQILLIFGWTLCVFDLTWNNMTAYFYDDNNTIITQANDSWTGEDCVNAPCGFANQYYPLRRLRPIWWVYNMQAVATDRAITQLILKWEILLRYDTANFVDSNIAINSVITNLRL